MAEQLNDTDELLEIAAEFLRAVSNELDPHTKKKGIIGIENKNSVSLLTPSHIQFAKYGRGPGKKPPFENIFKFVKADNIQFEGTDQRGTAFAIQALIGKNGTKNWVQNAPNALEEAINKNFEEYQKQLGIAVSLNIETQIGEIYTQILPKSTFKM